MQQILSLNILYKIYLVYQTAAAQQQLIQYQLHLQQALQSLFHVIIINCKYMLLLVQFCKLHKHIQYL